MELRQLKYFIAVADLLNFTRAANSLYIAQPTLSQQISALETELGTTLFIRDKNSVRLTPVGNALIPIVKDILSRTSQMQDTIATLSHTENAPHDRLAVTCSRTITRDRLFVDCLTRSIGELKEKNPLFCHYFGLGSEEKLLASLNAEFDLAFMLSYGQPLSDKYKTHTLSHQELQLFTWHESILPDNKKTIVELLKKRPVFWYAEDKNGLQQITQIFARLDVAPKIFFLNDIESIEILIASHDHGVAILPKHAANFFTDPYLQHFSFHCDEALIYLTAVWKASNPNPILPLLIEKLQHKLNACEMR